VRTWYTVLPFVALLLLFTGCAHDLHFQTVEARSGQPLAGVEVTRRKVTSFSYFHRTLDETAAGATGASGFITVKGVTAKDVISFRPQGHHGASAALADGSNVRVSWRISAPTQTYAAPCQFTTNSENLILVPLAQLAPGQ